MQKSPKSIIHRLSSVPKLGFTLIELLVVISIIGILATLAMTNFNAARERARDLKRKQGLRELKTALQLYYSTYNDYPADYLGRFIDIACEPYCEQGDSFSMDGTVFMSTLPEYMYDNTDDGSYRLKVILENASDSDLTTSQAACPGTYAATEYVVCPD